MEPSTPARLKTGAGLVEARLYVHDAKLAVNLFPVSSHGPKKSDRVRGDGDIRVISARHEHRISVSDRNYQFRILGVAVYEL